MEGFGGPSSTPMMEKEMITMIVDTLPVFYYEKMVGYMPSVGSSGLGIIKKGG